MEIDNNGQQTVLVIPDERAIRTEINPFVKRAKEITVLDQPTHQAAQEFLIAIARLEHRIMDEFSDSKRAAHAAHKSICALEAKLLKPLDEARKVTTWKCRSYESDQRRVSEEKERELRAVALKAAEERKLMDAIQAEQEGDKAGAEAIMAEPVLVPVVHVETETARVEGISSRTVYSAVVTDMIALVKFVAGAPEWINLIEPNMPALNQLARAQRDALKIPGVKIEAREVMAVRTA